MNASQIINDEMTLEEKLAAIDKAMQDAMNANENARIDAAAHGLPVPPPLDPADLTQCEGCQ